MDPKWVRCLGAGIDVVQSQYSVWELVQMCLEHAQGEARHELNICGSVHHAFIVKIIPIRCNNCGLFFANALLYMFRVTIPPIIRSTCAVYGHR